MGPETKRRLRRAVGLSLLLGPAALLVPSQARPQSPGRTVRLGYLDSGWASPESKALLDSFRRGLVCMRFSFAEQRTFSSRCSGDGASRIVVDHLGINMFAGKMDCQSGPLRRARKFFPQPSMNALPRCLAKRRHAY